MKPFAESSVQNRAPIFSVIKPYLRNSQSLLEIGSGTGQHAVYFASELPLLQWQTSELPEHHQGIQMWLDEARLPNIQLPVALDVCNAGHWQRLPKYDVVYTANTLHIMSADHVCCLFEHLANHLREGGVFIVYGPFNYKGEYTSESNQGFDAWLKHRDAQSGIRDFEWLQEMAELKGMILADDVAMPANNRTLVWKRL
ncbi:MAG: Methylase [uncultured Thiotrichaceae bacterium]|uniref:Methylase n=1 Tax=uncultured Thiotrichaceae bacterium TaxID=298394 RepID=A0A6S6UAX4_9GAMM|nr:MAG: Methylase [uncultured Thiotrichaceae bacterium]